MRQLTTLVLLLLAGCSMKDAEHSNYAASTVPVYIICLDGVEYYQTVTAYPSLTPHYEPGKTNPKPCN